MEDPEAAIERLAALAGLGVQLAIDDFGTGYSSMAYLKRFPVDVLKIDGSFVRDLGHGGEDAVAILTAIVRLAESLRLTTLAEGIESPHQLDELRRIGCQLGQGYLLGRPVVADQIGHLLGRPA
jgi:EAL domain-containing protein (putative c-di-GMP-specific phosphodiesterase class I)